MISPLELRKAIGDHALIADLEPHHLAMLAALAHRIRFFPGEMIFCQGERSNWFYFLASGEVQLEMNISGELRPIEVVRGGQELGWSALFGESKKNFTARAATEVNALAFDGSDLRTAFHQDPAFGYRFMRRLLARLSERLDTTRIELTQAAERQAKGPDPDPDPELLESLVGRAY